MRGTSMKRILIVMTVLLLALSVQVFAAEKRTAAVDEFYGEVLVKREASEKSIKVFKNMRLDEGDTVITGKDSKLVLKLDGDKEVIIAANTVVVISELSDSAGSTDTTFTLKSGGVGSKIEKKLDPNSKYRIKTPTAVMGVRGTEFYVQVRDGKADVWLASGTLEIEYRMDGKKLARLSQTVGELKSKIITAPNCLSLPQAGENFREATRDFGLNGLYKEFLDEKAFEPLGFEKSDFIDAVAEANEVQLAIGAAAVTVPDRRVAYEDIAGYEEPDDDDEPAPANQVYVGTFYYEQQQIPINSWCSYSTGLDIHGHTQYIISVPVGFEIFSVPYRSPLTPGQVINELYYD